MPTPGSFVLALQLEGSATSTQAATGGIVELVSQASPISLAVLGILLLFSVVAWAVIAAKLAACRKVDRQTADVMDFVTSIVRSDVIAPPVGTRRLATFFAEQAASTARR